MYKPQQQSQSEYVEIRGLRHHIRRWGPSGAPTLVLLHGWMDTSASFQFVVDKLQGDWNVIAPDWRGFGRSAWTAQGYWFPDYYADLEVLLEHCGLSENINLVGHSMGGNVAGIYSGLRNTRIRRYISLEGFGMPNQDAKQAPQKLREWLDGWQKPPRLRPYPSFDALADKLQKNNPRLSQDFAAWLALDWGVEKDGQVMLRADPWHKARNPVPYRSAEADACWAEIQCPVLYVYGEQSSFKPMFLNDGFQDRLKSISNLTVEKIDDAGHMLHHDQPAKVAELIERFLA